MPDLAAQIESVSALAEPQRRALYRYVVAQPEPVSRDQAAAATGLPRHTAKFHLDRLAADGLLDTEFRRLGTRRGPGAGRPTKLYRRSAREFDVTVPDRRYALAAAVLAAAAEDSASHGTPIREAVRTAAAAAGTQAARESGDDVLTVLAALGFEPRDEGAVTTLANCPFHRLAVDHPDLTCGMSLHLVGAVLAERGADATTAVLDPAPGRCCVVLTGGRRQGC
ncbi:helix-turn-helix transcriptional regulator [Pseudonocardia benzenivorans]|uniref:Transcriptional regulator n=2 Tax=Pseudonocardia TaxID=1847 RepID=F4D0V5_PSEUX|nr:helix-turn-helix domain-containing protein [Pseudonocardia dioxanivorans]AEA25807.1 putative transcriptional regulator [Pseudonocardia dioxanivorans CB1190]GJF06434.1 ArsR family transcriptional regulator [Pseudonocardia sp. D17]